MRAGSVRRRRSDLPDFVQTDIDIDALARSIFARYAGPQPIVVEGTPAHATFFNYDSVSYTHLTLPTNREV